MKKYIIAVLLLFIPCVTYALTMCARDNSLVVALNSSENGINYFTDPNEWIWYANFDYGRILGEATCLSWNEVSLLSQDTPKALRGVDAGNSTRLNCYCRITHPALSNWHLLESITGNECSAYCLSRCAVYFVQRSALRSSLFNAIGK